MNKVTLGIIVVIGLVLMFIAGSYVFKKLSAPAPVNYQASVSYKKEDLNKDGKVDSVDEAIVTKQFGCQRNNPCWNKVIGKTLSGDNPIYASDLDMNGDGVIDLLDIQQMKNAE